MKLRALFFAFKVDPLNLNSQRAKNFSVVLPNQKLRQIGQRGVMSYNRTYKQTDNQPYIDRLAPKYIKLNDKIFHIFQGYLFIPTKIHLEHFYSR